MRAVQHPYGADLGRLNPACTATRHGTYSAYSKGGCRCPHAREATRLHTKRRREGRTGSLLVDSCGMRRRVQALWAIGHSSEDIIRAAGLDLTRHRLTQTARRSARVRKVIADRVAVAYRELSGRPGGCEKIRDFARRRGYPTPIFWGPDIDDPAAVPDRFQPLAPPPVKSPVAVDELAVRRALAGEKVRLNPAEETAALRAAVAAGESLSRVSNRLGINYAGAQRLVAGELTPQRAKRLRVDAEVAQHGHLSDYALSRRLGVNVQTIAGSRRRLTETSIAS